MPVKPRRLTFERLMAVGRVGQPAVSPDGTRAVFVMSTPDLGENRIRHSIHLLELASGASRELTPGPGSHQHPAWSPDGRHLAFVSDREDKGGTQLWTLPLAGGEARRLTSGFGGAAHPLWSADGRRIAFTRQVVISPHLARPRAGRAAGGGPAAHGPEGPGLAAVYGLSHPKAEAQVFDELFYRHWDSWRDGRRNHIFLLDARTGAMADVTPYDRDAPAIALGSERDYDLSPDGNWLAYVANPDRQLALSTNNSVFLQRIRGLRPVGRPVEATSSRACEAQPRFAPGGGRLWFLAMSRPGYEADRMRLRALDLRTRRIETFLERFDRDPSAFALAGDAVIFLAQDRGRQAVFRLDPRTRRVRQLTRGAHYAEAIPLPGGEALLVSRESARRPAELYRLDPGPGFAPDLRAGPAAGDGGGPAAAPRAEEVAARRLTRAGEALRGVELHPAESFWYRGDRGHPVQGFLLRPPGFRRGRRYPLILLIHGGPQSAWLDQFGYRWSGQMFASRGAVVAMLNPRGSTGYGQRFTDGIRDDWNGACYRDLIRGVEAVTRRFPFVDGRRVAAAGGSFGGYMVNWIAGRTDRFRALVCHDGIFHSEMMGYTTEELWFAAWEHRGLPPQRPQAYARVSPHRNARRFRTPTLVIHGGKDYRCPVSEGIALFTALQVMGVPSRFLHFPEEGHWVLKPANSQVWYEEVLGWLMKHLD